jgi:hypothetical protein
MLELQFDDAGRCDHADWSGAQVEGRRLPANRADFKSEDCPPIKALQRTGSARR